VLLPQRGDSRQGMENVAHGAKTDDKEAVAGLGVQDFILAEVAELAAPRA
jgi:hypothetical protein